MNTQTKIKKEEIKIDIDTIKNCEHCGDQVETYSPSLTDCCACYADSKLYYEDPVHLHG